MRSRRKMRLKDLTLLFRRVITGCNQCIPGLYFFLALFILSAIFIQGNTAYTATSSSISGIAVGKGPNDIAINPEADIAVVTTQRGASVADLGARSIIADLAISDPEKVAIDSGLNLALVASGLDNSVSIIDLGSLSVIAQTTFDQAIGGIAVNPANHTAVLLSNDSINGTNSVIIWDIQTQQIIASVQVASASKAVAVDPGLDLAVVVGEKNIKVIDLTSNQVIQQFTSGVNETAVSVNPETHLAAIADEASDTVTILGLVDWQAVSIPVSKHPKYIAINQLDNRVLVISTPNESKISSSVLQLIDLNTDSIIGSYALNQLTEGVAVNNFTNIAGVIDDETDSLNLIQLPNPVPFVNSVSPGTLSRGSGNQTIAVSGSRFIKTSIAAIQSTAASYQVTPVFIDNHNLQVPVPDDVLAGTGSWQLTITNPSTNQSDGGSSIPQAIDVVNPVPAISSLLPLNVMAGTQSLELDVYGSGFFNDTSFYINSEQKAFTYDSYIKANLDLSASDMEYGRYLDIKADNPVPGGGYSQPARFTVLNPMPVLNQLSPDETLINTQLSMVINGTGFVKTSGVQFNGQSMPFTYQGWTGLQVNIPAAMVPSAGYYPVEVINPTPGGGTSNLLKLTVNNPLPVLGALSQTTISPNVDTNLTLTGSNFIFGSVAALDGSNIPTTFMDANDLNILVPAALAVAGGHNITVTNPVPGGGVSNPLVLTVKSPLPPDPATVAPAIDNTVATNMLSSTQFLYTGANPIQNGVAPGTIQASYAAVIRGKVFNRDGSPMPGVNITILGHPEFGGTQSRADGAFDMAVNGGGVLTVKYDKPGFISIQHQVNVPWQDYAQAPDAALIPMDSAATSVNLASTAPIQMAQSNPVTDDSGTRQATLLFNQGTTATMVMPDGSTQPVSNLTVRATEFTAGPNGPAAMPGPLPPSVGYTYAVDYSVDQALAAGAKTVQFSKPVISYTDNFLHFHVGTPVPSAYYDPDQGVWVPSDNGLVIQILSITNGMANLDVDGSGTPATSQELTNLGITTAELQQLAAMYQSGQSFWRVPINHFSLWDFNWPFGPPQGATAPNQPLALIKQQTKHLDNSTRICHACVIEVQNQTLGESVNIAGTPFSLNYNSSLQPGRVADNALDIPLSGTTLPPGLKRIELDISVAGQNFTQTFDPAANQSYSFTWNGLDAYDRPVQGGQPITTKIGYVYDGVYLTPSEKPGGNYDRIFGHFSYYGTPVTGDRTRQEVTLWQTSQSTTTNPAIMGHWNAQAQGFGGWTLSIQHAYDPIGHVLYLGDGSQVSVNGKNNIVTIAGNGQAAYNGDGGPAVQSGLNPSAVAADSKGNIYVADQSNSRIRKIDVTGVITTIAGDGGAGYSGDGGPAIQASLNSPSGVAVDSFGNIYIADQWNNRIRKIDVNGTITTIAGNGQVGYSGNGGSALQASLNRPSGVAVDSTGNIYIADALSNKIRKIDTAGLITTIAGNGNAGYSGDGIPAQQAALNKPSGVAVDSTGNVYIADQLNNRIRKVDTDGIIATVAGNGGSCGFAGCDTGDGGQAIQAALNGPTGVAVDGAGNLFIADSNHSRIRKVDSTGVITTVAGNGIPAYSGDGGPASEAALNFPIGVAVDPAGDVYIADTLNNRVREVTSSLPGVSTQDILIPSEDGSELYVFDGSGRHLRTVNALTGAVIYSFTYDQAGHLTVVTDGDGNVTTIGRDGSGNIVFITAPGGQRTTFGLDANGYLASAADPAGNVTSYGYTSGGLMTSETDPKGNAHSYAFDSMGRLMTEQDPAGGSQLLSRSGTSTGYTVSLTTGMGLTSTYEVETNPLGTVTTTDVDPAGRQTVSVTKPDGASTETAPDGTITSITTSPDPRFGMLAPITNSMTITTPSGLQYNMAENRTVNLSNPADPFSFTTLTDIKNVNGNLSTRVYDSLSKTITDISPTGRRQMTILNNRNKVITSQTSGLFPINFAYDTLGRLTSSMQGMGTDSRVYSINYDSQNRVSSIKDPLLRNINLVYDQAGRITQDILPDGSVISYNYDASGNVISITPPGKSTHRFDYTPVDLIEKYIPPSVGVANTSTAYNYDLDHRLTEVDQPAGSSIAPTDVTESTSFSYDGSLITSVTWTGVVNGSVVFTYNNDFKIAAETVNGGNQIGFSYDKDGLLTEAGSLIIVRDSQTGFVNSTTLGNVTDNRFYNGFGEPISYYAFYNGTTFLREEYQRDKLGRIASRAETINGSTDIYDYSYDLVGRLIEVKKNGVPLSHYDYDSNSNRVDYVANAGIIVNATYDAQDRLMTYGNYLYTYSDNGELASKAGPEGTTQYAYDDLGNLMAVLLPNGMRIDYVIDGQNRRVGKRINGVMVQGFLYENQLKPIAELTGDGSIVSQFIYGARINVPEYMIRNGITYRIISDNLGSPRVIIDVNTGTIGTCPPKNVPLVIRVLA